MKNMSLYQVLLLWIFMMLIKEKLMLQTILIIILQILFWLALLLNQLCICHTLLKILILDVIQEVIEL